MFRHILPCIVNSYITAVHFQSPPEAWQEFGGSVTELRNQIVQGDCTVAISSLLVRV